MGKKVTVRRGLNDLYLPNGVSYDGGQEAVLTDAQFAQVDTGSADFFFEHVEDAADPTSSSGGAEAIPMYSYDGTTGLWTVQPGRNPGCARFGFIGDGYPPPTTPGEWKTFTLEETLSNPGVASLQEDGTIRFAAPGLYLISSAGGLSFDGSNGPATEPEVDLRVTWSGPPNLSESWSNVHPDVMNDSTVDFTMASTQLCHSGQANDLSVSMYSKTYPWTALFDLTIVRLD